MARHVDVLVAGAGPAGAATGLRLARAGWSVMLVERSRFGEPRVGESLAPSVQPLLRELGVWDDFQGLGPLASWGTSSAWGSADVDAHSHVMSPYGCGWHVDRRAVDGLLARSAAAAGVRLLLRAGVEQVRFAGPHWEAGLSSGEQLTAGVVVDATGRTARIGRRLGARRLTFDRLVAVSRVVHGMPDDQRQHLLVETAEDGWWYSAPLPDGRTVVMLMTDADLCRSRGLADADAFDAALAGTARTRERLGVGRRATPPQVYPATSMRLQRDDSLPWLAVGDAALAVDPVSGSGVIRALRTAEAAATTVDRLLRGDAAAVAGYERDRDAEFTAYLLERAGYYAAEARWVTPFWQRRRLPAAA